jgi:hypothetical protein
LADEERNPQESSLIRTIYLNPVRASMVSDPADYRWSSYGEAMGGGAKGNGKTARAGLVRVSCPIRFT